MSMPAIIELPGVAADDESFERAFGYLRSIDERFSTFRPESEISRINRGELPHDAWSDDMREIFALAADTKRESDGYFDIRRSDGIYDTAGIVKGWAIKNTADLLLARGHADIYVEVAGDIQTHGASEDGTPWKIGIRNPLARDEVVKVIEPRNAGVATSGTAAQGKHIWDPHTGRPVETMLASITIIGPDVCEADRFATAAFAMGTNGVYFIEKLPGFEAYAIDTNGLATMTSHFNSYVSAQND